ncbi:MAG: ParB/RepB/Spo0J family partition protein [Humidesulfovibrio sp.]|uniref:ParB/RepB/Spo0J family partition protein n=1 Tax=Humidesulfovibrio sp. TaxID=2910988 RepID=UPI0027FB1601|nr:ParB/RepB/Spo0J family partition protein [Humidesulfovibrio sp.]MDQ7836491.1 ParB/RepB/Spo0J family partition protein [Humidesulfovibrio sp.]
MAIGQRGLGRGLDALLGSIRPESVNTAEVRLIPISTIVPNPHQPRKEFDPQALEDLSASIKVQGVLQPILVRPLGDGKEGYELVAGERRTRASKMAGLKEIPALVRALTDMETLAIALIENLQREDLNAIEEARGFQQLLKDFGLNQEELARQVGKSRSALANSLRLLNLPDDIQADIQAGVLTAGHGRAIMAVDEESCHDLFQRIKEFNLSVRQAEAEASFFKENGRLAEPEELYGSVKPRGKAVRGARNGGKSGVEMDEAVRDIQTRLAEHLGITVKISGTQDKGVLSLSYKSLEQLTQLAQTLGLVTL